MGHSTLTGAYIRHGYDVLCTSVWKDINGRYSTRPLSSIAEHVLSSSDTKLFLLYRVVYNAPYSVPDD